MALQSPSKRRSPRTKPTSSPKSSRKLAPRSRSSKTFPHPASNSNIGTAPTRVFDAGWFVLCDVPWSAPDGEKCDQVLEIHQAVTIHIRWTSDRTVVAQQQQQVLEIHQPVLIDVGRIKIWDGFRMQPSHGKRPRRRLGGCGVLSRNLNPICPRGQIFNVEVFHVVHGSITGHIARAVERGARFPSHRRQRAIGFSEHCDRKVGCGQKNQPASRFKW